MGNHLVDFGLTPCWKLKKWPGKWYTCAWHPASTIKMWQMGMYRGRILSWLHIPIGQNPPLSLLSFFTCSIGETIWGTLTISTNGNSHDWVPQKWVIFHMSSMAIPQKCWCSQVPGTSLASLTSLSTLPSSWLSVQRELQSDDLSV